MSRRRVQIILFLAAGILLIGSAVWWAIDQFPLPTQFDGQRAYQDVLKQVAFGPRISGSQAHVQTVAYIQRELQKAGWQVKIQQTSWRGFPVQNILAYRTNQTPQVILGAHYDSRSLADQDPGPGRTGPVPGANDGASGVAVLLELARTFPSKAVPTWLVFFDAEDDGGLNGRDWMMGSQAFVANLTFSPRAVIILDMIGDADLNIYIERNSNPALVEQIWAEAKKLGHEQQFIPTAGYFMEDDHTPFLEAGIPAVDIIDFDYPYWHTAEDTPDKVSPESLQIVGETIRAWLTTFK